MLERKEDIIPKLKLLKFKKTNKKIFLRKSHKKNVNITKGSEKTKQFIEPASKEIHSKEEETTNRKPFYHSYKGFATVIEYLSKFEWFNNASFQNKQLPS